MTQIDRAIGGAAKSVIIALEVGLKIRRTLRATSNISFYRNQVSFTLSPIEGATST
jgi:hypothetical protein